MATTNIKISMDSKLKKEFEEFCDDVGMDTNTALKKWLMNGKFLLKLAMKSQMKKLEKQ